MYVVGPYFKTYCIENLDQCHKLGKKSPLNFNVNYRTHVLPTILINGTIIIVSYIFH